MITIVVLLILAGVGITAFMGENGIIIRTMLSKEETEKNNMEEAIDLILLEWQTERYKNNLVLNDFLDSKLTSREIDRITDNGDGTYIVEKDGYEVKVNMKAQRISEAEKAGIMPEIEVILYKEDGTLIEEGVGIENAIITVNILNDEEIENIDEIKVVDINSLEVSKEASVIGVGNASYKVSESGTYIITVKGTIDEAQKVTTKKVKIAPEAWELTNVSDSEWYSYNDISNNDTKVNVNKPQLRGEMTPIKYIGETQTGSKWANAMTADGSMWVWIPRYAYRITDGYHTNIEGEIEVAFIDKNNKFLNASDSGTIVTDPNAVTYENNVQKEWLVHPAFTSSVSNGGGFGEVEGIWVGKFEATGSYDSAKQTGILSVKPGKSSLVNMTMNQQYLLGKNSTFGENVTLNSHMAKNSEWGATAYLGHSKYGTNKQKVERNMTNYIVGGSNIKSTIYTTNKKQSTTYNATGVYDMNGGTYDRVASYVNNGLDELKIYGGEKEGDLFGATEKERATSTPYKMVYEGTGEDNLADYNKTIKYKGDSIYEVSNSSWGLTGTWFKSINCFPTQGYGPFFSRSDNSYNRGEDLDYSSTFDFSYSSGAARIYNSFRVILAF